MAGASTRDILSAAWPCIRQQSARAARSSLSRGPSTTQQRAYPSSAGHRAYSSAYLLSSTGARIQRAQTAAMGAFLRDPARRPSPPTGASLHGTASSTTTQRRRIFSYSVAASFIAKDRPYDPSVHVFDFDPHAQTPGAPPAAADRPESGQDAFFVSRVGGVAGAVALGVADGVGGWMDSGVDPADFSHGLCNYMARAAAAEGAEAAAAATAASSSLLPSARGLMDTGYRAVCHDRAIAAGGSTAVVGVLAPDGTLDVANLGDSGFVHLRLNAMHACSAPQTHAFNTPYQLSVIPPNLLARMAAFGGAQLSDMPRDAEVTRHALRHGDVLVFASDGVWDNLFNQDILALVSRAMAASGAWRTSRHDDGVAVASPAALRQLTHPPAATATATATATKKTTPTLQSVLATQITGAAKAASVNATLDGPFAKEVKRYYPQETWHGGKVDDICVVVAVVSEVTADGAEDAADASSPPLKSKL